MNRTLAPLLLLPLSFALRAVPAGAQEPPPPPPRPIPGLTAPDGHPGACVDCHRSFPERGMDVRLGTFLAAWRVRVDGRLLARAQAAAPEGLRLTGKHPDAKDALGSIPGGCLTCHGAGSRTAPPFGRLMHVIHLGGGQENHFLTAFQGECTHCHKLDARTGAWSLPSGPERG